MHREITDQIRETASLYALGALPDEEARWFESHLETCAVCREEARVFEETASRLGWSVPEMRPPESLRERLLQRISPLPPGMSVVRKDEGEWRPTEFPGITVKPLHVDRASRYASVLMRMEPGSGYPPHRHTATEHCLVLEGDIRQDQLVLGPGDYNTYAADSIHPRAYTEGGCLLLIMASLADEVL
jgi:anti-sigma factor ChrR (cupin superfamily)